MRPPTPLIAPQASAARSSAAVAVGSLVAALLGAVLALLIVLVVGEGPRTDSFFAAYSLYTVFILFGSNLRIALVALIGGAGGEDDLRAAAADSVRRLTGAAALAAATVAVLSPVLGPLLVPGAPAEARTTATVTLAILAAASYCQIAAAALSAVLAAGRRFSGSALLYVGASTATLAVATGLMLVAGIVGAALGVLAGAIALYAGHLVYLRRFAFAARPALREALTRVTGRLVARGAAAAAIPLGAQLNVTLALAAVSGVVGAVTAYSYAYFLMALLLSATAATLGFVSMPGLVEALRDRGTGAQRDYLRSVGPLAVFLFVPLAAAYATFGRPVLDAILAGPLTPQTVEVLWDVSRLLLIMGALWALLTPVTTLLLATGRLRALALLAAGMVGAQAAVVVPLSGAGPAAVAAGHVVVGVGMVLAALALVFGRGAARAGLETAGASLPALALACAFPLLALTGAATGGWVAAAAMALVGIALYLAVGAVAWPSVGGRAVRELLARG